MIEEFDGSFLLRAFLIEKDNFPSVFPAVF